MPRFSDILALLILLTAQLVTGFASDESVAKERFLASYEPAMETLRQRYTKDLRVYLVLSRFDEAGKVWERFEVDLVCGDDSILVKTISKVNHRGPIDSPKPRWQLLRPDGLFTIEPAEILGQYVITSRRAFDSWSKAILGSPALYLCPPLQGAGLSFMSDYIRSPEVSVLACSECDWQGRKLTQLRIRDQHGCRSLYFDPSDSWLLHGKEFMAVDQATPLAVSRCYYGEPEGGIRPLRRYEYRVAPYRKVPGSIQRELLAGEPFRLDHSIEYVRFTRAKTDASDFWLDRFGLPEPAVVDESSRRHLWLFGAAGVVALLAVAVSYRRRLWQALNAPIGFRQPSGTPGASAPGSGE